MDCNHDVAELRKRTCSNGTTHYGYQCVRCLASVPAMADGRTWISHSDVAEHTMGGEPPAWVEWQDSQICLFNDEGKR